MRLTITLFVSLILLNSCNNRKAEISGELKKWHKITLTFNGPNANEVDENNPFLNYRLLVTFKNGDAEFTVPGYFAADGDAANTSSTGGNKWRVHFTPNKIGEWSYSVSFKQGENISIETSIEAGESAKFMDGTVGTFIVGDSDKSAPDLRAKGRLQYVGKHYLQFEETGEYFLKVGADAPENFLAYKDFDATTNVQDRLKTWEPHAEDFSQDAEPYLWNNGKGKNMLGAINYLASKGMNVFSFLTYNVDGDDRNVFPYILNVPAETYEDSCNNKKYTKAWSDELVSHTRFDVSKLDQWEKIFAYGESKGMYLHFKTQETENDQNMDGGELGLERKLYCRELIARFGHHLALNWNLGEENTQTTNQLKEAIKYIKLVDPYDHNIVLHTFPNQHEKVYEPLLGNNSDLTGLSIQTNKPDFSRVHNVVKKWVTASTESNRPWVVAVDEPGDATHSLITDEENPEHNDARINALWGTFMAGGAGVEWYFGYKHPNSDLTCQDWKTRDKMWDQSKYAINFFTENEIPFWKMKNNDEFTADTSDYCFVKENEVYLIFLKQGGSVELAKEKFGSETVSVSWYNPRTGSQTGSERLDISSKRVVASPPMEEEKDWLLMVKI